MAKTSTEKSTLGGPKSSFGWSKKIHVLIQVWKKSLKKSWGDNDLYTFWSPGSGSK